MPKCKIRKAGDDIRINKGKYASELNFDIMEQHDEEKSFNCDEEFPIVEIPDTSTIDRRTFNEIIIGAFQEFNSKSSQTRSNAIGNICIQLQLSHNPVFLMEHIETVINVIRSALESGNTNEIDGAARLISLAAIQLPDSNRSMHTFHKTLTATLRNHRLKLSVRLAVCNAIGILTFLYEKSDLEIFTVMKEFKEIFHPKTDDYFYDDTKKTYEISINNEFKIVALENWMFLSTLLPPDVPFLDQYYFSLKSIGNVSRLLESPCINLRIAFAKAIAVVLECGLNSDKYYLRGNLPKITESISAIRTVWKKNGVDLKTPWEVHQYIQKGITPSREIKIGKCVLELNTWALNVRYDMICNVVGSANIMKHLSKNEKLLNKLKATKSTKVVVYPAPACSKEASLVNNESSRVTYCAVPVPIQQQQYDLEKLAKNLENATGKSPLERTKAVKELCKELQLNHVPNSFLEDRKTLIMDIILRTMKRDDEPAQISVIRLATLIVLQLGHNEQFCSQLSAFFSNTLRLSTTSLPVNASICTALSIFELVDIENTNNVQLRPLLDLFRQKFSGSQPYGTALKRDEESYLLRTKALESWGLLITLCSPKEVCSLVRSCTMKDLTEMLHTPNVEFRIVCGQVISLVVEQGRIHDINYLQSDVLEVCNVIKDLLNDRTISKDKHRAQSPKLREILKFLEDGSPLLFKLRFNQEIHELKTWSSLFKYKKLLEFIGSDLNTYLLENQRIRDIIPLGPKAIISPFEYKPVVQHKLTSAAKKKSKTKENRLHSRRPKFECI